MKGGDKATKTPDYVLIIQSDICLDAVANLVCKGSLRQIIVASEDAASECRVLVGMHVDRGVVRVRGKGCQYKRWTLQGTHAA